MKKHSLIIFIFLSFFGFILMPKAYDPNVFLHPPLFNNSPNEPDVWKQFGAGTTYSFSLSTELDYEYMNSNVVYVLEFAGERKITDRKNIIFSNNKCKVHDVVSTGRTDNFWGSDWSIYKLAISCTPTLPSNSALATADTTVTIKNNLSYNMNMHLYKLSQMLEDDYSSNSDVTNSLGGIKDEQHQTNQKLDSLDKTQQETNDKLDNFLNSDIPASDKAEPNTESFDNYTESEDTLKDAMSSADLSNIDIAIDTNSSKWVWDTLTGLLQSHSLIFTMAISILSIGIIKLALGR